MFVHSALRDSQDPRWVPVAAESGEATSVKMVRWEMGLIPER